MKTEIECRLLEIDVEEIKNKLHQSGAKFIGDYLQMRYCYDFHPVKKGSWIRLRTNGESTTLTIKEIESNHIDGTKECEIIVSDFETTDELLNKLGYFARSKQENRRIQYMLDGVEIDIDFWPYIPTYVEFEAENEADIKRVFDVLDLDYSKTTTMDVDSLYKYYNHADTSILVLEDNRKTNSYK